MNRIDALFQQKKKEILSIYFTAGYPKLEDTCTILRTLQAAGADLVEVGMPYSDPMADGPTIQESGSVAIKNGMTVATLFAQIRSCRAEVEMPIIVMGYLNQMMQFGMEAFLRSAKEAGVDGLIVPDLPADVFEQEYRDLFNTYGIHLSFLITPQTSEARIRHIDSISTGFIYVVSDASITGAKAGISEAQIAYFKRIEEMELGKPRLIGFGISNAATFHTACQHSQGAIIGSAFIKSIGADERDLAARITQFMDGIRPPV
ncbi:MAG: tryptophan synthase subunit alpha [Saprospiraceae bacterium]|nr:tryptophan synthase subunit alpha [Saprospiraceae bacterium]